VSWVLSSNSHGSEARPRRPALRKASGFPANVGPPFSTARAGRLSHPARAVESLKAAGVSERQSLSAKQAAEPQTTLHIIEPNSDSADIMWPAANELDSRFRANDRWVVTPVQAGGHGTGLRYSIPKGTRTCVTTSTGLPPTLVGL
jgi:hypothetical protein